MPAAGANQMTRLLLSLLAAVGSLDSVPSGTEPGDKALTPVYPLPTNISLSIRISPCPSPLLLHTPAVCQYLGGGWSVRDFGGYLWLEPVDHL